MSLSRTYAFISMDFCFGYQLKTLTNDQRSRSKIQDIKEKMFPIFISWKTAFGKKNCYSSFILQENHCFRISNST